MGVGLGAWGLVGRVRGVKVWWGESLHRIHYDKDISKLSKLRL